MKTDSPLLAFLVGGLVALALIWPAASWAQPSGCYKACPVAPNIASVPPYFTCLGARKGTSCTVCPGHLTGKSIQVVEGKTVSCFKACAKGFVWDPALRQCCPGTATPAAQTPATAADESVELIVSSREGGKPSRVSKFFSVFRHRVQTKIDLAMTRSQRWSMLRKDVEAVKKAAATRGVVVTELATDWTQIMREAPADARPSGRQQAMMQFARADRATTGVKMLIGSAPAILESALIGDPSCPAEPVNITLALGDGAGKTIARTGIDITRGAAVWRGTAQDVEAPLMLIWWPNGRIAGTLHDGNRLYSIRYMGEQMYTAIEMSGERMPSEHASTPQRLRSNDPSLRDDPLIQQGDASALRSSGAAPRLPRRVDAVTKARANLEAKQAEKRLRDVVIDVIVAYTAKAAAHYNDIQRDLVDLSIEEGNESFRRSGLGHIKLRLVHAYQTTYVEEGAHFDHVWRFADKGDGYMEEIHGLRNKYRGDVAVLIVDDAQGCGLATRVYADPDEGFAVVHHGCAALSYTLAHEIGHLIGARHEPTMDKLTTPFAYGHGYVNGTKWRDIMSYRESCNGCPRIPVWSSPKVLVKGEPAGTLDQDNARVILEEAARVAAFR